MFYHLLRIDTISNIVDILLYGAIILFVKLYLHSKIVKVACYIWKSNQPNANVLSYIMRNKINECFSKRNKLIIICCAVDFIMLLTSF